MSDHVAGVTMPSPSLILDQILTMALKAGAEHADGIYMSQAQTRLQALNGRLEKASHADTATISIRLIEDQRVATVSTSDFDLQSLSSLIERGMAIAKRAPIDPANCLVPSAHVTDGDDADLDLVDPELATAESLLQTALDIETSILDIDQVSQSGGAGAAATKVAMILRSTNALSATTERTIFTRWASAMAGHDASKVVSHYASVATHQNDLESVDFIGAEAGRRATAKSGAIRAKTGTYPIVMSPERASELIQLLFSAISGPNVARGASFLRDKLGQRIFPKGLRVTDDPGLKRGLGSRTFDGEGVASQSLNLIDDGILTHWVTNAASAHQLGAALTGHALPLGGGVSASNLYLAASDRAVEDLMADIPYGLYITDFLGQGANLITGEYSQAVSGFVIADGKLAEPVKEATIAGHLLDMFAQLQPANDLKMRQQVNAPTIRIEQMRVAG